VGILWWKNKARVESRVDKTLDPDLIEAKLRAAEVVVRGHRVSAKLNDRLERNGFTALAARIMGGN
jgi:hypothetical protein